MCSGLTEVGLLKHLLIASLAYPLVGDKLLLAGVEDDVQSFDGYYLIKMPLLRGIHNHLFLKGFFISLRFSVLIAGTLEQSLCGQILWLNSEVIVSEEVTCNMKMVVNVSITYLSNASVH